MTRKSKSKTTRTSVSKHTAVPPKSATKTARVKTASALSRLDDQSADFRK
jgi:hypothetical protein